MNHTAVNGEGQGQRRPFLLVLAPYLTRRNAGAAHATIEIANTLHRRARIDIMIAAHEVEPGVLEPGIPVISISRASQRRGLWRIGRVFGVADARKSLSKAALPAPDMAYTQSLELGLGYRSVAPTVPIVSHPGHVLAGREVLEEGDMRQPWHAIDGWAAERIERASYRSNGWEHVVSTALVAETRRRHFGLPEGFFVVQPLSVDTSRFGNRSERNSTRERLGIARDDCVIVSVARMVAWKNLHWLVRAAQELPSSCHIVLVGDGAERARLEAEVPPNATGRVHFTGHCDPVPYLAAGDVFALPSAIESFGVAYAEAMSMGLPCIGLRFHPPDVLSSAEDVIEHGHAGFVVDDEQDFRRTLALLATDGNLRARTGAAARARAHALFSNERYASFLEERVRAHAALSSPSKGISS